MTHNNFMFLVCMTTVATMGSLYASQVRRVVPNFSASSSSVRGEVAGSAASESGYVQARPSTNTIASASLDPVAVVADKTFSLARLYLEQGNAPVAVFLFQQAAEVGNAKAYAYLGDLFRSGEGVCRDCKKALEYYQRAAKQGNDDVYSEIGTMYLEGEDGVTQSTKNALAAFQKGYAKGDLWSTFYLGHLYLNGSADMETDGKLAVQYLEKVITALSGTLQLDSSRKELLADAYYGCFYAYENGIGVAKDQKRSWEYAYKAAQYGSAEALGFLQECAQGDDQVAALLKPLYDVHQEVEQHGKKAFVDDVPVGRFEGEGLRKRLLFRP